MHLSKNRNCKIFAFLAMLMFCCSLHTIGQGEATNSNKFKNNLTFNLTTLVFKEARFGYERHLLERHIIRASLGVKYPNSSKSFRTLNILPFIIPLNHTVTKGFSLAAGYDYIIGTKSRIYVSGEISYHHSYYRNKYFEHSVGVDGEDYVSLQSMTLNKTGFKSLIGKKINLYSGKKVGLQLDLYIGVGYQYRSEELIIYKKDGGASSIDEADEFYVYDPPEIELTHKWIPTLHCGIQICLPF